MSENMKGFRCVVCGGFVATSAIQYSGCRLMCVRRSFYNKVATNVWRMNWIVSFARHMLCVFITINRCALNSNRCCNTYEVIKFITAIYSYFILYNSKSSSWIVSFSIDQQAIRLKDNFERFNLCRQTIVCIIRSIENILGRLFTKRWKNTLLP